MCSSDLPSGVSITFSITGTASHTYTVDLYNADTLGLGGSPDVKTYLGTITITTDASGNGTKTQYFTLSAGKYLTASMNDPVTADSGPYCPPSLTP